MTQLLTTVAETGTVPVVVDALEIAGVASAATIVALAKRPRRVRLLNVM